MALLNHTQTTLNQGIINLIDQHLVVITDAAASKHRHQNALIGARDTASREDFSDHFFHRLNSHKIHPKIQRDSGISQYSNTGIK